MNKISLVILCSFVIISFNLRGQCHFGNGGYSCILFKCTDRKIDGLTTEVGYDQWEAQAFFYKKLDSWMFAAGLRYQTTGLDFSDKALLDEDRLHSIDLAFYKQKTIGYS